MTAAHLASLQKKASLATANYSIIPYEVLCAPIAPVPNVPYVQQGFFVQASNLTGTNVSIDVGFVSDPYIGKAPAPIQFAANFILNANPPVDFTNQFLESGQPPGFFNFLIAPAQTIIFGIQYLLLATQSKTKLGSTPQENFSSRGYAYIVPAQGQLVVLATVRQSFTDYDAAGNPIGFSQSAYSVPVADY